MENRKPITKKTRFEVFKRDSFTCQYCGKSSPDVVLHIDHIKPVSNGGTNRITNLITSCADCNLGKGAREISDNSSVRKRKAQLDQLQERKEQLEFMMKWEEELLNIDDKKIESLHDYWSKSVPGFSLNEKGIEDLRKLVKKYDVKEILTAIKISVSQYLRVDSKSEKGGYTNYSVEYAWKKIPGILKISRSGGFDEDLKKMYYIRGILRNRGYCNDVGCMQLMKTAKELNVDLDSVEEIAKTCHNWSDWKQSIEKYISEHSK